MASILSDVSDHSDMNFIYILSANKCQQQMRKNDRKNTLKQIKHQNEITVCLLKKHTSHVTKAAGIKVFYDPPPQKKKNEGALAGTNRLVKDR